MSKAVRKINKAHKKILFEKPKELGKKVWSSKIGRAIVIAAAIYFTAGAASAYFGAAGAGGAATASGASAAMGSGMTAGGMSASALGTSLGGAGTTLGVAGSGMTAGGLAAGTATGLGSTGLAAAGGATMGGAGAGLAGGLGMTAAGTAAGSAATGLASTGLGAASGAYEAAAQAAAQGIAPEAAAETYSLAPGAPSSGGITPPASMTQVQAPLGSQLPASTIPESVAMGAPEASNLAVQVGANGAPLGQQTGGLVSNMMNGAKSVGEFMSKNKLYGTALQFGGNMMSSYARQKAEEEAIARRRQEIINGYRSGFGQQLWRY